MYNLLVFQTSLRVSKMVFGTIPEAEVYSWIILKLTLIWASQAIFQIHFLEHSKHKQKYQVKSCAKRWEGIAPFSLVFNLVKLLNLRALYLSTLECLWLKEDTNLSKYRILCWLRLLVDEIQKELLTIFYDVKEYFKMETSLFIVKLGSLFHFFDWDILSCLS